MDHKDLCIIKCRVFIFNPGRKYPPCKMIPGFMTSLYATGIINRDSTRLLVTPKRVTTKHVCPTSEICQENKIKTK